MLVAKSGFVEGIRLGRSISSPTAIPMALSNTQKVFGSTSLYGTGTTPNRLAVTPTTGFAFGTGDFTIEFWFQPISGAQFLMIDFRPLTLTGNYPIVWWNTQKLMYNSNQVNVIQSAVLPINTWYAAAAVRQSNVTTLYLNGTSVGTWADNTNYLVGSNITIGANGYSVNGNPSLYGYMDELRISNIARYSANYTPATEPFIDDVNTLLLVHFDGEVGSKNLVDDNT